MNREYHKWFSPNLRRTMELLIFGHSGTKVLFFPTRTARFYDYEDWKVIDSIRHLIENGHIQVYCVDSIDQESFYCFWAHPKGRIQRHVEYEGYILNEVMPFANEKNAHPYWISVGCSMGAYHAVNISFKHPQLFCKVLAMSGRYDLTINIGMFVDLMDGYYSDCVYYNSPSHFVPNLQEGEQLHHLRQLDITIVCGNEDVFVHNNRELSRMLWEKDIHHKFYEWEGLVHKAKYWRQMLPMYL